MTPEYSATTLFHCSDLHFGHPAVPEQYEAIESLIRERKYDVVVISGDLTQRHRTGEFQRARSFIQQARQVSEVLVIPGNHDVPWWKAPFGFGKEEKLYAKYRRYIDPEIEPVLRVDGAVLAGLNTSQGVLRHTLTWNLRDIGVIGHLDKTQLEHAEREFEASRGTDARVIVMHHNPVRGELSGRHGLKNTKKILGAFAEMGVDLVLCGHDHQEAVHYIEHTRKGTIIATAGTVSNRSRGGRPSSVNSIRITPEQIEVAALVWSDESRQFLPGPAKCFAR